MASIVLDDYDDAPARLPISGHPAFPAIVALWFSALLGVGSLVLPAVLLERVVVGSGVAALIPSAAPPLGITARGLIALTAAVVGATIGIVVARRVANAHSPQPVSRISTLSSGARRPLSVKEELGGEKVVNGESLPINRRRALAISEDERPSDFLYRAPLPGEDPDAPAPLDLADVEEREEMVDEPLELCTPVEDEFPAEPTAEFEVEPEADEDYPMTERQEFQPVSPFQQFAAPEPELEAEDELGHFNNVADPRGGEPLPFAAPSLMRRVHEPHPEPEPEPEPQAFEAPRIVFEPVPAAEAADEQADWEDAPLEGLGLVQLVQRLGSTIERRREWIATTAPTVATAPVHAAPVEFEAAPAEEAAQAIADYFSSSPAPEPAPVADAAVEEAGLEAEPEADDGEALRPEFLRSLQSFDDDEGDDEVPDFSLPLHPPVTAAPDNDEANAADEDEGGEGDAEYSSLLGMKNPFVQSQQEFVRVDEPEAGDEMPEPAVVFPGQQQRERFSVPVSVNGSRLFDPPGKGQQDVPSAPQPVSADADAALRAALATLQKTSGAA